MARRDPLLTPLRRLLAQGIPGLALALLLAQTASTQETPSLASALALLEHRAVEELWPVIEELKKTYQGDLAGLKNLADGIYTQTNKSKLAGASILFARKEATLQTSGQVALQQLARDCLEKDVRIAALRLLRKPVLFEQAYLTLNEVAKTARAAGELDVQIEATLSLWELDNHPSVREPLRRLLDDPSLERRNAAALALAETGYYQEPVAEHLRALAREPSLRGKHARALLRAFDRDDSPEASKAPAPARPPEPRPARNGSSSRPPPETTGADWPQLLAQIEALILENSISRDRFSRRELYLAAIRGMVSILDEYSVFQDPGDVRQVDAGRLGTYWGLCADLVKPGRTAPLVIARAHRGGPAHEAGLRAGDRIHEVNGVPTGDLDRADLAAITSSQAEGEVLLLISRPAWPDRRMIRVQRGELKIPLLQDRLLPENIGYIKLSRVGPTAAADFEAVVDGLEARGMQALVIDLRDNPGGNLKQAVRIVDLFVGNSELPILSEIGPREIHRIAGPDAKPRHPMVILVNRQTASAAEVIAGALQDFGLAILVGETTYGKGVKQVSLTLPRVFEALLGGESRLLLSSGRLHLPSGRPIQAGQPRAGNETASPGGIDPDLRVDSTDLVFHGRQPTELLRVQYSEEVTAYVHNHREALRTLFANGKLPDPASLPNFQQLHSTLTTSLSPSDVRYAIRAVVQRSIEEEDNEMVLANYRQDPALRQAILELLRKLGRDPLVSTDYQGLVNSEAPVPPSGSK